MKEIIGFEENQILHKMQQVTIKPKESPRSSLEG